MDKLFLMKLYTVAESDLRMCIKEDNPTPHLKGDIYFFILIFNDVSI